VQSAEIGGDQATADHVKDRHPIHPTVRQCLSPHLIQHDPEGVATPTRVARE
jgi:hypothetical protein